MLHDSEAFPNAYITVDPWHFTMRFAKTLNKSGAGVLGSSSSSSNSNSSNSSRKEVKGKAKRSRAEAETQPDNHCNGSGTAAT